MFLRKKRRFGASPETIKIKMRKSTFTQLILADEAMRHIDTIGLPADQFKIRIQYEHQPFEEFNARDRRPILHRSRMEKIEIVHIRSDSIIWSAEVKP